MLRNILVGYDDSRSARTALQQAVDIAEAAKAWIHLVSADEAAAADAGTGLLVEPDHLQTALTAAEIGSETEPDAPLDTGQSLDAGVNICRTANVACTARQVFGRAGEKLAEMARLYNLLVVGQSREPKRGQPHHSGPNIKYLLRHCPVPLLVGAETYKALDVAMVIYRNDAAGGRALNLAGELCSSLNIPLKTVIPAPDSDQTARTVAEIEYALKAFHVEHEVQVVERSAAELVPLASVEWGARCVIMSYPPVVWPWSAGAIRVATATPNLLKLIVP